MIYARLTSIAMILFVLNACANSPATNYYHFTHLQVNTAKSHNKKTIQFDPIEIAEVLKRRHIISYGQLKSKLIISPQHLWIGDMSELLSDVTMMTMRGYFPEYNLYAFPAPRHINVDYRIAVRVQELAGQLGGQSYLQAQWLVRDANNVVQINQSENFVRQSEGADYAAYVEVLNQLVGDLNNSIAESLAEL